MIKYKTNIQIFVVGEFYHIYNHGVETLNITKDIYDSERFLESLKAFNVQDPIGSIYQQSFSGSKKTKVHQLSTPSTKLPLVRIIAYCINPNHYHLILQPLVEGGISLFMQKFGGGFTRYINEKYKRKGGLFRGKFKARHITTDADFMKMSAYVNLNNKVHQLSTPSTKLVRNSFKEYSLGEKGICDTSIVLGMFNSKQQYAKFVEETIVEIVKYRKTEDYKECKREFYAEYFD